MKALKRNCKVPFLIGGYFCSERSPWGFFNGLYFTRALISSRTIPGPARSGLQPALAHQIRREEREGEKRSARARPTRRGKKGGGVLTSRDGLARDPRRVSNGMNGHYVRPRNKIAVLISLQRASAGRRSAAARRGAKFLQLSVSRPPPVPCEGECRRKEPCAVESPGDKSVPRRLSGRQTC